MIGGIGNNDRARRKNISSKKSGSTQKATPGDVQKTAEAALSHEIGELEVASEKRKKAATEFLKELDKSIDEQQKDSNGK